MKKVLMLFLLLSIIAIIIPIYFEKTKIFAQAQLRKFSSYEELKTFVNASSRYYPYYEVLREAWGLSITSRQTFTALDSTVPEYSTTNIQVEGVDEADIIKTDGEYIYMISEKTITILKAYPPEEAQILCQIELNGTLTGTFINGDRLAVFEELHASYGTRTFIRVYDISDRETPNLKRSVYLNGSYFNSRMIGDYVYAIINRQAYLQDGEVGLPKICSNNEVKEISATEIYYSNITDYYYTFTTVIAINTQDDMEEPTVEPFLLGATRNMYVSQNNIYVTFPGQNHVTLLDQMLGMSGVEGTEIHRIYIENGQIDYQASGQVPGTPLNQFSMDEYNGYFRIATTTGHVARILNEATSLNHVYVLDMDLNIVGRLENLAPGEEIYSARFMGDRCYLVTFKKVDPLFVIDLEDATNPRVLGQLKITGYSDYLHPYDENHLIGIGKETVEAEEGDFAWYQGVKISLFDVSDVENPKEIDKYEIGDRGTDSPVLRDHKAFLFDKTKNLLVIPVLVAEIDEEKYPNGVPSNTHGDYVWQGAYVFNITLDQGLVLKGRITHLENDSDLKKSGYYFYSAYSVKRSLYMDNVLYTISDKKIKMHLYSNMTFVNEIELP